MNNNKHEVKKFWNKNATLVTLGLAVAALGTSFYIMSTFSRNTSTVQGTDQASVAKFEYEIKQTEGGDDVLATSSTPTIDIFDTVVDSGVPGSGGKILAPGTAGYFEFLFRNKSNTPVKVTFDNLQYSGQIGTDNNIKQIPIIFYFNGKYYSSLYSQSLSSVGQDGKTGADWKYYFRDGDSANDNNGIRLTGDIAAFKAELNAFSTNGTGTGVDSATCFLNSLNQSNDSDYLRIAWFYPFDARLVTGENSVEEGSDPGSGYKIYSFDTYNGNFTDGTATVSMSPIIRTSGVDKFTSNTHAANSGDYGFISTSWHRSDANISWGEDQQP